MKIRFGVSNLKYAVATTDNAGVMTYGSYKPVKGAKSITLNAVGETVTEYADNIEWFVAAINSGYEGSINVEEAPKDFLKDILGMTEDANGVLFEDADQIPKEFALAGQFENSGDATVTGKRFCFFRVTASRPNMEGSTKEQGITVNTDTINIRCMPRPADHMVKATADSDATGYATWFDSVVS